MRRIIEAITLTALIVASLLVPTSTWAQGTWTTKAAMPIATGGMASGVVNGVLYFSGGCCPITGDTNGYNASTDSWTTEASLPMATVTGGQAGAVVNGIFYVMGGNNGFVCADTVQAYDPSTNSWSIKASMPTPRCNVANAVVNGLIYAIGGGITNGPAETSIVEVYNPATDSWATAAPMPTPLSNPAAVASGGLIYVIGGFTTGGLAVPTNQVYDPATNTWSTRASMPTPRGEPSRGLLNDGRIYIVGGQGISGIVTTNESYDPVTDTWRTEQPLPDVRDCSGSGVIGNALYVVGGCTANNTFVTTNEAFTPSELNTPGKVTGGGYIQPDGTMSPAALLIQDGINASVGDKATFGFVVQFAAGDTNPTGNLQYNDHGPADVTIRALSFSLLAIGNGVCGANTHAKIGGSATVTGPSGVPSTQDFEVEVDDCGGAGLDTFKITTTGPTSYMAMGPVVGGNITIHKQ